jgi:hypothetical protein
LAFPRAFPTARLVAPAPFFDAVADLRPAWVLRRLVAVRAMGV